MEKVNLQNRIIETGAKPANQFQSNPLNHRKHPMKQRKAVEASLRSIGWIQGVIENQRTGHLIDGHERVWQALQQGEETPVPYVLVDLSEEEERLALAVFDRITGMAEVDAGMLEQLLGQVNTDEAALMSLMEEMAEETSDRINDTLADNERLDEEKIKLKLHERFIVPPFSVLDARQGYWQDRKRAWIDLGIKSELGRGAGLLPIPPNEDNLLSSNYNNGLLGESQQSRSHYKNAAPGGSPLPAADYSNKKRGDGRGKEIATSYSSQNRLTTLQKTGSSAVVYGTGSPCSLQKQHNHVDGTLMKSDSGNDPEYYYKKQQKEKELGRELSTEEFQTMYYQGPDTYQSGTSIFDPVLCEIAYRWFCPKNANILDPFSGGSVRGIVASILGHKYTGIDLSDRQIEANKVQGRELCSDNVPTWLVGDSTNIIELAPGEYDFIFSCPPYADLEVYSDDPADLSTMEYEVFIKQYRKIIYSSVSMLQDNRFACFVVGDIRNKKGIYRNFVSDTISSFLDAGMSLYNEAILVTAVGSLPIRVGKQFQSGRKLGKTHQNVLVFYKGDPKLIKEFGNVECGDLQGANEVSD